ncbi:MAG: hypothetical protein R2749_30070 [Acidimicrobiales bacterium]
MADVLDVMTTARPYQRARTWDEARAELVAQAGRQFDPQMVAAAVRCGVGRRQVLAGVGGATGGGVVSTVLAGAGGHAGIEGGVAVAVAVAAAIAGVLAAADSSSVVTALPTTQAAAEGPSPPPGGGLGDHDHTAVWSACCRAMRPGTRAGRAHRLSVARSTARRQTGRLGLSARRSHAVDDSADAGHARRTSPDDHGDDHPAVTATAVVGTSTTGGPPARRPPRPRPPPPCQPRWPAPRRPPPPRPPPPRPPPLPSR